VELDHDAILRRSCGRVGESADVGQREATDGVLMDETPPRELITFSGGPWDGRSGWYVDARDVSTMHCKGGEYVRRTTTPAGAGFSFVAAPAAA
jgi:hypothetical protein